MFPQASVMKHPKAGSLKQQELALPGGPGVKRSLINAGGATLGNEALTCHRR